MAVGVPVVFEHSDAIAASPAEWFFAIFFICNSFYIFSKGYYATCSRFQYTQDPMFSTYRPTVRHSLWLLPHFGVVIAFEICCVAVLLHLGFEAIIWAQFALWFINSLMVLPVLTQYGTYDPLTSTVINITGILLPGSLGAVCIIENFKLRWYYAFIGSFHFPVVLSALGIITNGIRRTYNLPPPNYLSYIPLGPEKELPPIGRNQATWRRLDFHTWFFMKLVDAAVRKFVPEGCDQIAPPTLRTRLPLEEAPGFPGVYVSAYDENGVTRTFIQKKAIVMNHKLAPFFDDTGAWPNYEDAMKRIEREIKPSAGKPNVEWAERTTDLALTRFCFQGIVAHRVERVRTWKAEDRSDTDPVGEGEEKKGTEEKKKAPEDDADAGYAVFLDFMNKYPTRTGLARYGGDVFFDKEGKPKRIRYLGVDVYPGQEHWEYAKFAFRSSALVLVTIWDHVILCHFMAANTNVLATRQGMNPFHPIRRLLTPFVYRTVVINESGVFTLAPHRGLFHRATAFTWPALTQFYQDGAQNYRVESFPDLLKRNRTQDAPDSVYIYKHDGMDYYKIVKKFVHKYLKLYYPEWKVDDDLRDWWLELVDVGPKGKLTDQLDSLDQVEDYLAYFIFTVTAFHEQVGTVTEYILDPTFTASKWAPGYTICSSQTTYQMGIVAMLTGLRMPPLIGDAKRGDWTHVLLDASAVKLAKNFIAELRKFGDEVNKRNAKRGQAMQMFNPAYLETSVSI